jgi:hypothetical protein
MLGAIEKHHGSETPSTWQSFHQCAGKRYHKSGRPAQSPRFYKDSASDEALCRLMRPQMTTGPRGPGAERAKANCLLPSNLKRDVACQWDVVVLSTVNGSFP